MKDQNTRDVLFIGNSHTYCNDLPFTVKCLAAAEGFDLRPVMLSHGGRSLEEHAAEPEVRFNIRYGRYDYVVLQERAHPFGPEEKYRAAARVLCGMIRDAGSVPVIYACWARKGEREIQESMNAANRLVARENGALLAPVGEGWWEYADAHPKIDMYAEDGAHASPAGSRYAAECLWRAIFADLMGSSARPEPS